MTGFPASLATAALAASLIGASTVAAQQDTVTHGAEPWQALDVRPARAILGATVTNRQNENLGTIEDLVVDHADSRIVYSVLAHGGVLGMGDKYFAVPWGAFDATGDADSLILDQEKKTLENARGFDKNNWPEMGTPEWDDSTHQTYGQEPYWKKHDPTIGDSTAAERGLELDRENLWAHQASELIDLNVKDINGKGAGKISDLLIDTNEGRIEYAVIHTGGVLGVGGMDAVVPYRSLELDVTDKVFVLGEPVDNLKDAPIYKRPDEPRPDTPR